MATITEDKDIAYYLEHPEEVDPANTELVTRLLAAAGETAGVKAEPTEDEAKAAEAKAAEEAAKAEAAKAAKPAGDGKGAAKEEEAPVVARDGKSLIPFTVLHNAREAKEAAEAALGEAMKSNVALVKRLKDVEAGRATEAAPESTADDLEAQIAAVREEAPWLVPVMETMLARLRESEERVAQLQQDTVEGDKAEEQRLRREATSALEGNSTLLLWKDEAPELYEEAVRLDRFLRNTPAESKRFMREDDSVDFEARYERCVALVKAAHAGEDIPAPKAIESQAKPGAKPAPTPAEVKAAALAKLKGAEPVLTTLTDVPGGAPVAQSEEEAIEAMSVTALGSKLMEMTPDKLQAWLARNA